MNRTLFWLVPNVFSQSSHQVPSEFPQDVPEIRNVFLHVRNSTSLFGPMSLPTWLAQYWNLYVAMFGLSFGLTVETKF